MAEIRAWLRARFADLVALTVALGFFLTLAELLLMGHTEGIQALAPVTAGLGALLVGLGLLSPGLRPPLALALLLLGGAGFLGVAEHLEKTLGGEALGPGALVLVDEEGTYVGGTEEGGKGNGENEATPPPLAPLSLSGLALLGALALFVKEP